MSYESQLVNQLSGYGLEKICTSPFNETMDAELKAKIEVDANQRAEARRKEQLKLAIVRIAEQLVIEFQVPVKDAFETAKELIAAAHAFMKAE